MQDMDMRYSYKGLTIARGAAAGGATASGGTVGDAIATGGGRIVGGVTAGGVFAGGATAEGVVATIYMIYSSQMPAQAFVSCQGVQRYEILWQLY